MEKMIQRIFLQQLESEVDVCMKFRKYLPFSILTSRANPLEMKGGVRSVEKTSLAGRTGDCYEEKVQPQLTGFDLV